MPTQSPRIPRKVDEFMAYIRNTRSYLMADSIVTPGLFVPQIWPPMVPPTAAVAPAAAPSPILKNWQRLWLLQPEMDKWNMYTDMANPLYEKYSDKKESRTTAITDKLRKVMDDFTAFAQPKLITIEGCPNATIDDLLIFHIKSGALRDANPTRSRTQITNLVWYIMKSIGGGDVQFEARPDHDTKRASMFKGANLEIRYKIVATGQAAPISVDQLPEQSQSTKAITILHLGTPEEGKRIYSACRWIVPNNPARNSPWSGLQSIVIG